MRLVVLKTMCVITRAAKKYVGYEEEELVTNPEENVEFEDREETEEDVDDDEEGEVNENEEDASTFEFESAS